MGNVREERGGDGEVVVEDGDGDEGGRGVSRGEEGLGGHGGGDC